MAGAGDESDRPTKIVVLVRGVAPYRVWEGLLTEIWNVLLRERQQRSPGFDLQVVAVLDSGTRVTDQASKHHFKMVHFFMQDAVDPRPEPSRARVEHMAFQFASEGRRWDGLVRALAEIGIRTSGAELEQLPLSVELDELAEQLVSED